MLRTFMSGFSQQAGKMVAEVVVQMAMQTKTAQTLIYSVMQQPAAEIEEKTRPMGFAPSGKGVE
jgi:hypothetical protein|tara:strand:- start:358 stop:549 length:192 start_codon:yes stop_codon:yes gene_type:complete